jgi:hypothetical protein
MIHMGKKDDIYVCMDFDHLGLCMCDKGEYSGLPVGGI